MGINPQPPQPPDTSNHSSINGLGKNALGKEKFSVCHGTGASEIFQKEKELELNFGNGLL